MIVRERITGVDIHDIIRGSNLDSIRERFENLSRLTDVQRVIFVGSTAVGKSTLEQAIRTASLGNPLLRGLVSVSQRVVTRPPRADDGDGTYFCTIDQFQELVQADKLGLRGVKVMEGGRQEPYGYLIPDAGTLPIYFANNQTLKNRESTQPAGILQDALIVAIYAPDKLREQRLRLRSPELFEEKPEEAAFRLSREERAIGLAGDVHLILKNYGRFAGRTIQDTIRLIVEITKHREGGD